jgi:replicative DNA helicase
MTDQPVTMPHSPNAEDALIGAILIDPDRRKEIAIAPSDFYFDRSRWLLQAFDAVASRGVQPDFITICAELDARKQLAEIGGPAFVIGLTSNVMFGSNVGGYAKIIKDRAARRRAIRLASELATTAYDLDSDLTAHISKLMDALGKSVTSDRGAVHISQVASRVYDALELAAANPQEVYGIPTGFPDWDKISAGLQKREVVKLSGEPGVGKSLLALQVIINAAKAGHTCAIYSPEMSAEATFRRGLAMGSTLNPQKFMSGRVTESEWALVIKAFEELGNLPVYISDASQMSTMDLRVDVNRLKDAYNLELILIDYEALLEDGQGLISETERSMLISGRVHGLVKDSGIACISVGDMVKAGMNGTVKGQTGLAGSARMIHDADQILIMRADESNKQRVKVTWEKNREGINNRYFELQRTQGFPSFVTPAVMK